MKNIKKKAIALGVSLAMLASSALSMSASAAAEYVSWPASYNAYTGQFFATSSSVGVSNLRWTSSQISDFNTLLKRGIEFEYRPRLSGSVISKNDIWTAESSYSSNMPEAYAECQSNDPDDVSVGCGNAKALVAGTSYYGTMYLIRNTSFVPQSWPYTFEAEIGEWIPIVSGLVNDFLPLYYSHYNNGSANVVFDQTYTW